jgi:hypothetical protein
LQKNKNIKPFANGLLVKTVNKNEKKIQKPFANSFSAKIVSKTSNKKFHYTLC